MVRTNNPVAIMMDLLERHNFLGMIEKVLLLWVTEPAEVRPTGSCILATSDFFDG